MINWLEEAKKRQGEMVDTLSLWLQNNSVYDPDTIGAGAPFGKGVKEAFDFILDLAGKDGFETVNDDGYVCHIDYGTGDTLVGILGHVDVVPEGDNWTYPPFSGKIVDGHVHGRGSQDDKGPIIAAYFAMKILKDLNLPVNKKVRMILGGNEERDWKCVEHYFKNYPKPDLGFTPDGDFPLVYAEKEITMFELSGTYHDDIVIRFHAGTAANSVPDHAKAVLNIDIAKVKVPFEKYLEDNHLEGTIADQDGFVHLDIKGVSAHGSQPEQGVNAAAWLLNFIKQYPSNQMIAHFARAFADYHGENLGIAFSGNKMGALTSNLGIVSYENGEYKFVVDIRFPVEVDKEAIQKALEQAATDVPWEDTHVKQIGHKKGIYLDLESELISTLYKSYVDITGDTKTKPSAIGGGTFARAADNIVCFGMSFPYSKILYHQKDEAVSIDELVLATAIYAQAIYNLAR